MARSGRPRKVYSDNGKTFVAAAKWNREVMKDERFHDYLAYQNNAWQFNLSKAPWWGGQFERMVGLAKRVLYQTIGRANLRWGELKEVILDVEVILNNRSLSYQEDDVQLPILTPNAMMFGQPNILPGEEVRLKILPFSMQGCIVVPLDQLIPAWSQGKTRSTWRRRS